MCYSSWSTGGKDVDEAVYDSKNLAHETIIYRCTVENKLIIIIMCEVYYLKLQFNISTCITIGTHQHVRVCIMTNCFEGGGHAQ